MSCYHPLIGYPTGKTTINGKKDYWIRKASDSADFDREKKLNPDAILIPCGHCIGCRLDHSRAWADRMMLELETAKKAVFVTLTYDNAHVHGSTFEEFDPSENLYFPYKGFERFSEDGCQVFFPEYFTLDVRDCQLFMKRLRKEFDGKEGRPYRKIRFYLAGEYGEQTLRPHYHGILFGLGLSDFSDLCEHGTNELGNRYYISASLSKTWSCGFVLVADVNWKTCAYVARYVTKKWSGPYAIDYAIRNCIPEFSLMSRKPGIGRQYLDEHPDCLDMSNINLSTAEGGLKIQVPKYYLKQLNFVPASGENILYNPEKYDKIMLQRKVFAEDRMMLELSKTNLGYLDYLESLENKKLRQSKSLSRSKV